MGNTKRDIIIKMRVTPEERGMIETKMEQYGATCMAAYVRKMAIDGYVITLDLPELREISSLLRRAGGNINQIAKRINQTGRAYETDMQDILQNQNELLERFSRVLEKLARLN